MIVADTEAHQDGWRWIIVDLDTGERLWPTTDTTGEP